LGPQRLKAASWRPARSKCVTRVDSATCANDSCATSRSVASNRARSTCHPWRSGLSKHRGYAVTKCLPRTIHYRLRQDVDRIRSAAKPPNS
jgi:hypothetical protein